MTELWYWPDPDSLNDFPDPLGIEDEWHEWRGTMADGPSVFAEIFSREYIQNSWDSIQLKTEHLNGQNQPMPKISFSFIELEGAEAKHFATNFGLFDHVKRLQFLAKKFPDQLKDNRLGGTLIEGGDLTKIKVLVANELVGDGMSGKWSTNGALDITPSRLKLALVQSATGKSGTGTGGSWGQGKKAIAAASKSRVMGVYTCHPEADGDDPGVTRRFLGVTYWRQHNSSKLRHRGLGLIGDLAQVDSEANRRWSTFEPFTNERADNFVSELELPGFEPRDPNNVTDHGTSYFFVEPAFTPEDLVSAIERNWWPLLMSHRVEIEVTNYEGISLPIQPKTRKELQPFIKAYDVGTGVDATDAKTELTLEIKADEIRVGKLALVSDPRPEGWSFETPESGGNADLVALVRNDMVIAYQHFPLMRPGKPPPYVRGALVVERASAANEKLKMTEGHLHNSWKQDVASVGDKDAASLATKVLKQVNESVNSLRARIKPDMDVRDVRLRPFQKIFKDKGTTVGRSGPIIGRKEPVFRRFVIQGLSRSIVDYNKDNPTELRITSTAKIGVKPDDREESINATIDLGWAVREEAGHARDDSLLDISSIGMPDGFTQHGNVLTGTLSKTPVEFTWSSLYFTDDWTVVPDPQVRETPKETDDLESNQL